MLNPEVLGEVTAKEARAAFKWTAENLLDKTILTVENWLEVAYHLCKQRWDSSIEWLEQQPVSKILLMAKIQSEFITKQNEETKRAARKRK